jgi:hypothetical protein
MPYVIVPDQPREDAPPGHEYDHLVTPGRVLFDSAEAAYAHPVTPGGDVIVLRCEPPAVTKRSVEERVRVVWSLPKNVTVLPDTRRLFSNAETVTGRITKIVLTAFRHGTDGWNIDVVELNGWYLYGGEESGIGIYQDYGPRQRYELAQLPSWISELVKAELDGRSAR